MELTFGEREESFRAEVRRFIEVEAPATFACQNEDQGFGSGAWSFSFTRRLGEKGLIGLTWPERFGGHNKPLVDQFILYEELAYAKAPAEAVYYLEATCSTILRWGNEYLKDLLLPQAAAGNITFFQGLSEPNAGSDLLSLETRAVANGGDFLINGQKIWSSNGQWAHYGYIAARTDPNAPKHKGITMFIVDMKSDGINVRPLKSMAGGEPFSEVFFDNVRVPKKHIVGDVNAGLPIILSCLESDRFWARCSRSSYNRRLLDDVVNYCNRTKYNGKKLSSDPFVRRQLAQLAIEIEVCRMLFYRALWMLVNGQPMTYEASVAKTFADELGKRFVDVVTQITGTYGKLLRGSKYTLLDGEILEGYMNSPAYTLGGGTSEIQRNTIATRGLGMPRQ